MALQPTTVGALAFAAALSAPAAWANAEEQARALVERMCALHQEEWSEAETVEAGEPAYDEHHTECALEFVSDGRWFSFVYHYRRHVPRRWSWRKESSSLGVMVIVTDAADAQNAKRPVTYAIDDRGVRGRVTFGVTGTYGGTEASEHFYEPPDPALDDDECLVDACRPVGSHYGEEWQRRYRGALLRAHAHLEPAPTNAVARRDDP